MDIDIKWGRKGGIVIAMLVGRFSGANADLFERMLESGVDPSDRALILDFEHVTFLSSAGSEGRAEHRQEIQRAGKELCHLRASGSGPRHRGSQRL